MHFTFVEEWINEQRCSPIMQQPTYYIMNNSNNMCNERSQKCVQPAKGIGLLWDPTHVKEAEANGVAVVLE